jgi:hypothetical protein
VLDDLLEEKPLPRGTHARRPRQLLAGADVEQRVEEPRIAQIHLGGLHLTLADVLVPGRQLSSQNQRGFELI